MDLLTAALDASDARGAIVAASALRHRVPQRLRARLWALLLLGPESGPESGPEAAELSAEAGGAGGQGPGKRGGEMGKGGKRRSEVLERARQRLDSTTARDVESFHQHRVILQDVQRTRTDTA